MRRVQKDAQCSWWVTHFIQTLNVSERGANNLQFAPGFKITNKQKMKALTQWRKWNSYITVMSTLKRCTFLKHTSTCLDAWFQVEEADVQPGQLGLCAENRNLHTVKRVACCSGKKHVWVVISFLIKVWIMFLCFVSQSVLLQSLESIHLILFLLRYDGYAAWYSPL